MTRPALALFEGGTALSAFRTAALLQRLRAVAPRLDGVMARHLRWVATDAPLDDAAQAALARLLDGDRPAAEHGPGAVVVVGPRRGAISPWASKATDIARNCSLSVRRVERVVEYRFAGPWPDAAVWAACAALLHDRMTETVWGSVEASAGCSTNARPGAAPHRRCSPRA